MCNLLGKNKSCYKIRFCGLAVDGRDFIGSITINSFDYNEIEVLNKIKKIFQAEKKAIAKKLNITSCVKINK